MGFFFNLLDQTNFNPLDQTKRYEVHSSLNISMVFT